MRYFKDTPYRYSTFLLYPNLVLVQKAGAEWVYLLLDSEKHVTGVAVINASVLTLAAYTALLYQVVMVKLFIDAELAHERILQSKNGLLSPKV